MTRIERKRKSPDIGHLYVLLKELLGTLFSAKPKVTFNKENLNCLFRDLQPLLKKLEPCFDTILSEALFALSLVLEYHFRGSGICFSADVLNTPGIFNGPRSNTYVIGYAADNYQELPSCFVPRLKAACIQGEDFDLSYTFSHLFYSLHALIPVFR
jgi:hypothetical protein